MSRLNEGYNCSSRYDLYSAGCTIEVAKGETGDWFSTAKSVHTLLIEAEGGRGLDCCATDDVVSESTAC